MADTTTELEVLDEIVDVLSGQSGQYETVVPTLQQIRDLLGGGGGGGGYNPALSVGRADALTGVDSTAQWSTRESTGSGAATVRSVQGAVEVQDGELVPVQIAGIASTDAQGGELDAIEWPTQTLRAAGSVRDELTSDAVLHRIRTLVLDGTETDIRVYTYSDGNAKGYAIVDVLDVDEIRPNFVSSVPFQKWGPDTWCWIGINSQTVYLLWPQDNVPYATVDDFRAWLASLNANGTPLTFAYVTSQPTTTPISPALPMTYRVEQGGSESIIVPDGEVSAAPVLTVAEGESAGELVMDALACIATPDGPVATANHALNTYLTMGGKLYKVTSAIAVGETITAGTNVTETTVMSELIARTA